MLSGNGVNTQRRSYDELHNPRRLTMLSGNGAQTRSTSTAHTHTNTHPQQGTTLRIATVYRKPAIAQCHFWVKSLHDLFQIPYFTRPLKNKSRLWGSGSFGQISITWVFWMIVPNKLCRWRKESKSCVPTHFFHLVLAGFLDFSAT